jgi:hypothetical protein
VRYQSATKLMKTISQEVLEAIDADRVKHVLLEVLPQLKDDEELADFLADEINTCKSDVLRSPEALADILREHLLNFGCCPDEKDVMFVCETVIEDLAEPPAEDEEEDDGYNSDKTYDDGECVLCERTMPLTFHHLIPRTTHKKMSKRYEMDKKEMNRGIWLCRPCHSAIHNFITEENMALEYNSLDKLLEHEKVLAWIPYVQKQKIISKEEASLYHNGILRYKK